MPIEIFKKKARIADLPYAEGPEVNFAYSLNVPGDIEDEVDKDPLLQQKMLKAVKEVFDDMVTKMEKAVEVANDTIVRGGSRVRDVDKMLNNAIQAIYDQAQADADKEVLAEWKKLQSTRASYRNYKIKVVAKVSLKVASITSGVVGFIAGGFTFGASTIPSIISLAKNTMELMQEAQQLHDEVEETLRKAEVMVNDLVAECRSSFLGREVAADVLEVFFGTSIKSVKKCQDLVSRASSKCDGLVTKAHDAAKNINEQLKKLGEVEKALDREVAAFSKEDFSAKELKQISSIQTALDKASRATQDTLAKVISYSTRADAAKSGVEAISGPAAALSGLRPDAMDTAKSVMKFIDFGVNCGTAIADGVKTVMTDSPTKVRDTALGAWNLTQDLLDRARERVAG